MPSYIAWMRQRVGRQKIPLVGASACIRDGGGRLLWQRRSDFGYWGLPGGALELGESLPQCVVREVREETGLSVEPMRLIGIYSSPTLDVTYPNGDQVQLVIFCFECRADEQLPIQVDRNETLELAWFQAGHWPDAAPQFVLMASDGVTGSQAASFRHGAPYLGAPILGASGEPFYQRLRRYIGHERWIMPGAAAVIRDEAGCVLLQRRGDTGDWGLPAGAMELGERLDQTVIREIQEETGLEIEPVRVVGVYSGADFNFSYPNGDHVKAVSTLFECRVVGGSLKADGVESLEVRFFAADALPPLAPRHHRRIADALAGRDEAVF